MDETELERQGVLVRVGRLMVSVALAGDFIAPPADDAAPEEQWKWFAKNIDRMTPEQRREYAELYDEWEALSDD